MQAHVRSMLRCTGMLVFSFPLVNILLLSQDKIMQVCLCVCVTFLQKLCVHKSAVEKQSLSNKVLKNRLANSGVFYENVSSSERDN